MQQSAEYANEHVKVRVHPKPSCQLQLEVEAMPSLIKIAHQEAVKRAGKEVTIAGFRKGKAPADVIEKNYPKQVDAEIQKIISNHALQECLNICKLPMLNRMAKVGYNIQSWSLIEGAKLVLFLETEPAVPIIDPKTITLKAVKRPVVNTEKIEETIRQVQLFFARWASVTDRPVQENDFVILNVDVIEEDPPRPLFSGVRFEVKDRSMAKWMKELVLGRHLEEIVEGVSVPDEEAEERELLSPKKVRLKILSIETAELPTLDDLFAQKMGASSVQELYANVEKVLHQKAEAHVKERQREEVATLLLKDYPFEIPNSLIDREVRFRMQQLLQDPEYTQHWNQMTEEAKKRAVQSIAEQSEKAVRMYYLSRKILSDAKIEISADDLPQASNTPLDLLIGDRRDIHPQADKEVQRAEAFSRLMLEKAEDYIIAHANCEGQPLPN